MVQDRLWGVFLICVYILLVWLMSKALEPIVSRVFALPDNWKTERNYIIRNLYFDFRLFSMWLVLIAIDSPSQVLSATVGQEFRGVNDPMVASAVFGLAVVCLAFTVFRETRRNNERRR